MTGCLCTASRFCYCDRNLAEQQMKETVISKPRYTSRSFPPYAYVPGRNPHPTRDKDGHSSNGQQEQAKVEFDAEHWQDCEEYLYGIDLFNHGYWWEAHEALEAVWVSAGRKTKTGFFIQGIIQISVAHLKRYQRFHDVAQRMANDGLEKMHGIQGKYLGIDTRKLRTDVIRYFSGDDKYPVIIELQVEKPE